MEQKILIQQEELTGLHKRRGEHTQQIVDLNASLQEKDKIISDRENRISLLSSDLQRLRAEVCCNPFHIKDLLLFLLQILCVYFFRFHFIKPT